MSLERAKQLLAQNDEELVQLVERLDREAKAPEDDTRRSSARFSYRVGVIPCMIFESKGAGRKTVIYPRNISAGGIAFVHRGFLHADTEVHLVLRKREQAPTLVKGNVRSCRHISKMLHEVGVQFSQRINPSQFCDPDIFRTALAVRGRSELPKLTGRVLVICNAEEDRAELRDSLAPAGLEAHACAPTAAEGILKTGPFDVVITDDDLAGLNETGLILTLRDLGHDNPILVLTWTLTDVHAEGFEPDERTYFCQRPIDGPRLSQRLSEILNPTETDSQARAAGTPDAQTQSEGAENAAPDAPAQDAQEPPPDPPDAEARAA